MKLSSEPPSAEIIAAARLLCDHGFRVLERLEPRQVYGELLPDEPVGTVVLLDCETTGLDVSTDEIIQLAMVKATYGKVSGRLGRMLGVFDRFREPSVPITPEITKLTGITPAMVAGQHIDGAEVAAFLADAALIVAHNSTFDRPFCEKHWPTFVDTYWACSLKEIDWRAEGFEGTKLGYLAIGAGFWFDGHKALNDVWALAEILAHPLPVGGQQAFGAILDSARQTTCRVKAIDTPFDLRLPLKKRGYRWESGEQGARGWWLDVPEPLYEAELAFLRDLGCGDSNIRTARVSALRRYSQRIEI